MNAADLVKEVSGFVPMAPTPVVAQSIMRAARELCRDCLCWPHTPYPAAVTGGEPLVTFYGLPQGSQIVQIDCLVLGATQLRPTTPTRLALSDPGWDLRVGPPAQFYKGEEPNQIRLVPTPESDGELRGTVYLEPSVDSESLPENLVAEFFSEILDGTLAYIHRFPWAGQNYLDAKYALNAAATYTTRFETHKRLIRSRAVDALTRGVARKVTYGGY